ncbi:MAG: tetratricopeptide repeat protein [Deltaproteobacteria bacterium]|nr:tetratricopeptide repeat protein [Deltaproteobacteria bacterium]
MKRLFQINLLFSLVFLFGLSLPKLARADSEDFEFYKKYGHHSKAWDDYVKQGFDAYDQQNCDQAMTGLKQAIATQCQDALVYFKMAVCSEVAGTPYTALQYYQLAEEKLAKLEVIHRYQKDIYESYGRALFQAKRYDESFPYLVKAAAVGSPSFGLYYMVGYLYSKKNDNKAAIEFFDKALAQDTSKAPPAILALVYREVAKSYAKDKNYQKGMDLVNKALQLNPSDQESTQLRSEISNVLSQQSILQMIHSAEGTVSGEQGATNPSKPPPPAAAKLPPLESQTLKDPTPPLGTVQSPGTTPPASGSGSGTTLQPLPPPPPPK